MDLLLGNELGEGLLRRHASVGVLLQPNPSTGEIRIADVLPGSPARKAGLKVGQIVEEINGVVLEGKEISDCLKLMKGPAGTEVRFKVSEVNGGKPAVVDMIKAMMLLPG